MNRAEQAQAFCSAVFGGLDGDDRLAGLFTTVWDSSDKLTRWRRADQPGAVASLVVELDEQPGARDIYVGVGLTDQVRGRDPESNRPLIGSDGGPVTVGRPKREHIAGLLGLWADIDVAGEGHSDAHYPPSIEAAMQVVNAMRVPPTLVVHSGGGLQVWWMFTEPWLVRDATDPEAEHERMTRLAFDWLRAIQYQAELIGRFKVDSVFDLARLLRPAGTTNRKIDGTPRKVVVLQHDPNATYNPSDFDEYLPDPAVLTAYANPVNALGGARLSETEAQMVRDVNFAAVWARVNSPAYRAMDFTPPWLADLLELGEEVGSDELGKLWRHDAPKFKDDENRFDAALVRRLAAFPSVDTEGFVEALMCRRLRLVDTARADKVDPRRRMDYITRTVARFRAEAAHAAEVKDRSDQRMAEMASVTLAAPARPEPVLAEAVVDQAVVDDALDEVFTDFTDALIEHADPTPAEQLRHADDRVVAERTGQRPAPTPPVEPDEEEAFDPFGVYGTRAPVEIACLDTLTDLLIPPVYRDRGVRVWSIEYRDYGELQKGRVLLRLPLDFEWPVDRPSRYRPGRPLSTEWWSRALFDTSKGFQTAVERDCKIITRDDAPKTDWTALVRDLVPLWRRDSSGSDLAHFAHEWLFGYLMSHHGTGEPNEVGSYGRPWVRKTNGWKPQKPPVVYIDLAEFMNHCKQQPGAVIGRGSRGVIEYLKVTKRRPRNSAPGMAKRVTWYEVDPEQFTPEEWWAVIQVTRESYERSMTGKTLRAVGSEEGRGFSIDGHRAAR